MKKPRKLNNGGGIGRVSGLASGVGQTAKHNEFVIDDESLTNPIIRDLVFCPVVDGEVKGHGLVKRDWSIYPAKMFGHLPSTMPIIPRSEWDARFDEQEKEQSSLKHLRMRTGPNGSHIPSLDQNGQGYCWAYSTVMGMILTRVKNNQPYVRLSAHAVGCKVKGFRDQGGWCGLSAKFVRENGCPSVALWPEKSMSRTHDKPETWANAALHKVTEDYADLTLPVHAQNMTEDQVATCLFHNQPCSLDWDEWGHSVCGIRWCRVEAGSWTPEIINSWSDSWGDKGTGKIRTSWTIDGAIAILVAGASHE